MTGELFSLLAGQSILHTAVSKGDDELAFAEGFNMAINGNFLHEAFGIRTRYVLQRASPVSNFQLLSGLMIGTELKDLANTECPVSLVCSEQLKAAYMQGLKLQNKNRTIRYLPENELLVKGHCKLASYYF
jgi:2-keto-3-deoxy-galactonokinase